ncbi:MAG TPA: RT0821/Lpp0805 family surface protein [Alphaproteobacteria bacterium]
MHKTVRTLLCALAAIALVPLGASAQPRQTYGTDSGYCERGLLSGVFSTSTENIVGSALGAAAGGLLGSQFGKGSGKTTMTIAGILAGALAGGAIGRSMEPADQACVSRTLEHTPTGQTVAWQNPDNQSSYWVTPTRTYETASGVPCREYVTDAVIGGRVEKVVGTACRQPDGTWRVQN